VVQFVEVGQLPSWEALDVEVVGVVDAEVVGGEVVDEQEEV
jgi:hypothetical protein